MNGAERTLNFVDTNESANWSYDYEKNQDVKDADRAAGIS